MNHVRNLTPTGFLDAGAGMTRERAGLLAGEQVRVKDAISLLEDAREEISMHHSEKVEAKEFGEREISAHRPIRKMHVEQIDAYLQASKRFPEGRDLAELVKRLQAHNRPGELAQSQSRTPAHRFALLYAALHDARRRGLSADVVERLEEALEDLEWASRDEITAGLNSAHAAAEFGVTAERVETFQQTYADIVLGEHTLAQTLLVVLRRLTDAQGQDFRKGLKALLNALGADLKAAHSSTDPVRLQALVQDVYHLEVAGTVLEECITLAATLARRFGIDGVPPRELMQELVALTAERWLLPSRLRAMAERFGAAALLARIAFFTGSKAALRKMPVKVFADADTRLDVIDCLQSALDEAVAEEEEGQGE